MEALQMFYEGRPFRNKNHPDTGNRYRLKGPNPFGDYTLVWKGSDFWEDNSFGSAIFLDKVFPDGTIRFIAHPLAGWTERYKFIDLKDLEFDQPTALSSNET